MLFSGWFQRVLEALLKMKYLTMKRQKTLTVLLLLLTQTLFAQEQSQPKNPPVILETMMGSRGAFVQMMISKKFQSLPRFGVFTVSSVVGERGKKRVDDLMMQGHLTYEFYRGFTVNAGFHHTPMTGLRPTAGIMYTLASPIWTLVLFPRVDLMARPDVEMFGMLEYKPEINNKLKFYSRFQGMYVHNPDQDIHQKSGLALRAGLSYREFTFGAGFSSDWYGPDKANLNNLGGFVSFLLF